MAYATAGPTGRCLSSTTSPVPWCAGKLLSNKLALILNHLRNFVTEVSNIIVVRHQIREIWLFLASVAWLYSGASVSMTSCGHAWWTSHSFSYTRQNTRSSARAQRDQWRSHELSRMRAISIASTVGSWVFPYSTDYIVMVDVESWWIGASVRTNVSMYCNGGSFRSHFW